MIVREECFFLTPQALVYAINRFVASLALEVKMQAATLNDVSGQGQELRYLTAHYRDLQGLRMAPFWVALLVLTSLAKANSFSRGHLAWAAVTCTAAQFGWLHLSGRWYERRYGVVKEPDIPVRSGLISILHPEAPPQRTGNRRYGYLSGVFAVLFLIWALTLVPGIFLGHNAQPGTLAMLVTAYQIVPRCFYHVTKNWSVILRRVFAVTAVLTMIVTFINYQLAQMSLWTWMAVLLSVLLLLDLYDHWLLNHLLGSDFMEGSFE